MKKVRLGDIFEYMPKSKIKAGEGKKEGKYKFFTSSNIQDKYIDEFIYDGEYLIFGTGGKASINYCNEKFSTSTDNFVVKVKKEMNAKLIYLYFKSDMQKLEKGFKGASIKHISKDYINQLTIPMYNLKLQEKIVNELDKVQKIIDLGKKQIEELDELIKSQFVEMFGNIKNTKYEVKTLEELIDKSDKNSLKRGPFGGSLKKDDFVNEGYLVYEQRHAIHNDFEYEKYYIDKEKFKSMEMFKVIPGDLIVSCSGVTLGRIAEIPPNAKKGIINQALLKISLNNKIINNEFFIQQFRNEEIQSHLFNFSRGSGIPNFPSMNEVKKLKFICPNIEEQNGYESIVKQIDKQKFEIEKSLKETEKLQKSLMNRYFGE